MTAAFEVLAEPTRRSILDLLTRGERAAGEIEDALGLSQPGTSKHLRVLRDAGMVSVRKEAQRRIYRLEPEGLAEVMAWAEQYRKFWRGRLVALEDHLSERPAT
jgi:DNA-binding transcriptional ArsR family regulator